MDGIQREFEDYKRSVRNFYQDIKAKEIEKVRHNINYKWQNCKRIKWPTAYARDMVWISQLLNIPQTDNEDVQCTNINAAFELETRILEPKMRQLYDILIWIRVIRYIAAELTRLQNKYRLCNLVCANQQAPEQWRSTVAILVWKKKGHTISSKNKECRDTTLDKTAETTKIWQHIIFSICR